MKQYVFVVRATHPKTGDTGLLHVVHDDAAWLEHHVLSLGYTEVRVRKLYALE